MLEQRLEQDIKTALLAKDTQSVTTLRQVKSALLNVKVAQGKRDSGLDDDEVMIVLAKEAKKRQESADLYRQGGDETRAEAELKEKAIIEAYLPAQPNEADIVNLVEEAIKTTDTPSMGVIIGQVKQKAGPTADGSLIARIVKERLAS
jgi:uncharacterized protein YqeY